MDPVGISSGLLTLTIFAYQSTQTLYDLVSSFQHHSRNVRQLKDEVEALNGVLGQLQLNLEQNELDMSALERPVRRCGQACEEFRKIVEKCSARSNGPRNSFRDWFRITYMGKDIAGFTGIIAGYKATITVALGEVNLRTSIVTAKLLREYKALVGNTTSDLEEIMQDFNERMPDPAVTVAGSSEQPDTDQGNAEEERASIQQCLKICLQVSAHIDEVQTQNFSESSATAAARDGGASTADGPKLARLMTKDSLQNCKRGLNLTSIQLRNVLQEADRLITITQQHEQEMESGAIDPQRVAEDIESVKQCLAICSEAAEKAASDRINVFEDVSTCDDGQQVIISTMGDLISAKRVSSGSRSRQLFGQMSDETAQYLARPNGTSNGVVAAEQPQVVPGTRFENRHGAGRPLKGKEK